MIRTTSHTARLGTALLATASTLAFAAPALANDVLFSTQEVSLESGARMTQVSGLTQLRLDNGATVSFVDAAEYRLNDDGTLDLYAGSVTVAGGDGATVVRMPDGVEGQVSGKGSAARFSVGGDGKSTGHVLTGSAQFGRNGSFRRFSEGEMFEIGSGGRARQVVSNGAQATPGTTGDDSGVIAMGGDAGPIAAAQNGVPVTLGDALAAAGASGDILAAASRVEAAAANPSVETFPVGDLQLLVALAANLEGAYGGVPFDGAQADVIRTYLQFLANGGSGQNFLSAYSGFLVQYLELIRSGAAPSGFQLANLDQINSFIAFTDRTGGFGNLSARDRSLVDAYLAFIQAGGNADAFAGTFTDLTAAYFAFIRAGGNPADFTDATQATIDAYIAFLSDSGLVAQLSAADRALIAAYLQNGGLAFAGEYRAALDAYFAYLAAGNLPSGYTALDQATLQAYLATLQGTGLLDTVLGNNADFYTAYLAYLQGGGTVDGFAGLPANIFAGYATQLDAYFAFLAAGNLPSDYSAADIAILQVYLAELQAAGALDRFLGGNATFFADYLAFLQGGGQVDAFAGLNANVFAGYASALAAYYDYLANGGVPTSYGALTQEQIAAYIAALQGAGATGRFLVDLADFYTAYFAYLSGGGNPDTFAGLPVPPDFPAFAAALNAYFDFLAGGGLPADYSAADLSLLQSYLEAIVNSGQTATLLGTNSDLLQAYFAYLAGGGTPNGFAGLPIYGEYVNALNAYYAFLANGGLPGDYTALSQAQIRAYLDALAAAGGLVAFGDLDGFFAQYYAFLASGGNPANFAGLPLYADYVAALNAYYAYLAAGGTPSGYTVLTQAQIEAYLAALAGVSGGFGSFASLNAFFASYYSFILGGGDPDQFAGLPSSSGVPVQLAGYSGGFDPAVANINIIIGGVLRGNTFSGGESGFTTENFALDANGGLNSYVRQPGGQTRTNGSTTTADIFGNSDVLIGRWTSGNFSNGNTFTFNQNQGLHYMLARQPTTPFAAPTTGRIDYYLTAATRPTIADGSLAPGVFDAQMAILFGTQALLGFEGSVTFDNNGSDLVYAFTTTGGVADIDQSNVGIGFTQNGNFNAYIPGLVGSTCHPDLCGVGLFASFAGDGEDTVGATYQVYTGVQGGNVVGAAIFQSGPVRTASGGNGGGNDGGGGDTGGGDPGGPIASSDGIAPGGVPGNYFTFIGAGGSGSATATSMTVTDGLLTSATSSRDSVQYTTNANTTEERGGDQGVIGWSRFGNVRADYRTSTGQSFVANPFASQYWHNVWGAPVVNLPASGLINYELIGATTATQTNAQPGEGTFSGDFSVDFATLRAGLEAQVTFNGETYSFASNGGVAVPSIGIFDDGFGARRFSENLATTTSDGSTVQRGTFVQGFLAGDGASHAGLNYGIRVASSNSIQGAAAFRAVGSGAAGGGNSGASAADFAFVPGQTAVGFQRTNSRFGVTGYAEQQRRVLSAATIEADGSVTSFTNSTGPFTATTASVEDVAGNESFLIGRWTDGAYTSPEADGGMTLTANQGFHYLLSNPVASDFALPTSGTIMYDLFAATQPTIADGSYAPGTFDAQFAIAFGASSYTAGIEGTITLGSLSGGSDLVWSFGTPGGVANTAGFAAAQFVRGDRFFFETAASDNQGHCISTCTIDFDVLFSGSNANNVGMIYSIADGEVSPAQSIGGTALWVAQSAASAGSGSAGTAASPASYKPSSGPIAGGPGTPPPPPSNPIDALAVDWSRFAGNSVTAPGTGLPGTSPTAGGSLTPVSREQAEAWLGGRISFNPR